MEYIYNNYFEKQKITGLMYSWKILVNLLLYDVFFHMADSELHSQFTNYPTYLKIS